MIVVPFRHCSACPRVWETRDVFLEDAAVQILAYQGKWEKPELGLLLFNHLACGTTLAFRAGDFRDLWPGEVFQENLHGTERCRGFCQHETSTEFCANRCECAWVGGLTGLLHRWPKAPVSA